MKSSWEGDQYKDANDRKREKFLSKNDETRRFATKHGRRWTQKEDDYLIAHYGTASLKDIARKMGRSYCSARERYHKIRPREEQPIKLKPLLESMREDHRVAKVSYRQMAKVAGISPASFSNIVNHGAFPKGAAQVREKVEAFLETLGIPTEGIWDPMVGDEIPEDDETIWEGEMLYPETKKHFHLFRDPFNQEMNDEDDVFQTAQHRYIQEAILDAAHYRRFIAIVGEVGSGKTTVLKTVEAILAKEKEVHVVKIASYEKEKCSAVSITEALIDDLTYGNERPRRTREARDRQAKRILGEVHQQGKKAVLIMDEAHAFKHQTLRSLKRFYENEIGFVKLLGIVLLGQPELKDKFEEWSIREMTRRCTMLEMDGLNGHIGEYIKFKIDRAGGDFDRIFTKDAIEAIRARLRPVGQAHPLTINIVATKSMNVAALAGEEIVTPEIVHEV